MRLTTVDEDSVKLAKISSELSNAVRDDDRERSIELSRRGAALAGLDRPDEWFRYRFTLMASLIEGASPPSENACREALAIGYEILANLDPRKYPKECGVTSKAMGFVYSSHPTSQNIERALLHGVNAVRFLRRRNDARSRAVAQSMVGMLYFSRVSGDVRANVRMGLRYTQLAYVGLRKLAVDDDMSDLTSLIEAASRALRLFRRLVVCKTESTRNSIETEIKKLLAYLRAESYLPDDESLAKV